MRRFLLALCALLLGACQSSASTTAITMDWRLSRLYLRLMYGLAEFHGVPISDNNSKLWQDPERVDYNVEDYGGLFADLNQNILELAKQGKYSALKQKLSIPELKRSFMTLNLFHHSSGDDIGMSPLWDKKAGCYKRASYPC